VNKNVDEFKKIPYTLKLSVEPNNTFVSFSHQNPETKEVQENEMKLTDVVETKLFYKEINRNTMILFKTDAFEFDSFSVNLD